ncbi:MAG: hypothetical protein Q9216_001271 [Gyalolechia sp. 2 TL-2023]
MPHSRKELRKISKALRRSECGSNISTRSSSFSPAKDTNDNVKPSVTASAEDGASRFQRPRSREHSTARSLSEAFPDAAIQKQSTANEKGEHISDGMATFAPATPRHRLPDDEHPDQILHGDRLVTLEGEAAISKLESTSDHSDALVDDNLDKASASSASSSHMSVKDIANQSQPEISEFWRSISANSSAQPPNSFLERLRSSKTSLTLPTYGAEKGEGSQDSWPEQQAIPLDVHNPLVFGRPSPNNVSSTPTKLRGIRTEMTPLESLDGTEERPSQSMLVNKASTRIDQGSRTEDWIEQTQQHSPVDSYAFAPFKLATKLTSRPQDPASRMLPSVTGTTKVASSDDIEAASELQSEATTLLEQLRPIDRLLADMGRRLTNPSDFGSMNQNLVRHPQAPPQGYQPRYQHPLWFNSLSPYESITERFTRDRMPGTIPWLYHDISGPHRRQHDPITVPISLPQRRGLPPPNPTHRYQPAFLETATEVCRGLRYPDWTRDARGRLEIPKPPKENERTRFMNAYTKRFYGGQLDAVRDLRHVERPQKEFDLGGLLA